jgi:hypothetical protein
MTLRAQVVQRSLILLAFIFALQSFAYCKLFVVALWTRFTGVTQSSRVLVSL